MAIHVTKALAILKPTNLIATLVLVAIGYGGYKAYRYTQSLTEAEQKGLELARDLATLKVEKAHLQKQVTDLKEENVKLEGFVKNLTAETRVATVAVRQQRVNSQGLPVHTLEFTETDRQGRPLPSRIFDVVGKEVYFDALVIKFHDDEVKRGDLLRGKSLHLFRRAFGDAQEPRHGPLIATDQFDGVPNVYRVSPENAEFEKRLWRLFWHWADHPKEAESEGVDVLQIEALGIRPKLGKTYRIKLEHDGGLNIKPLEGDPEP